MIKVLHASDLFENNKEEKALTPIEFTHCLVDNDIDGGGWVVATEQPDYFEKVIYLGKCHEDGDMFACYHGGAISIYKGHLNDGIIE